MMADHGLTLTLLILNVVALWALIIFLLWVP
jgi:hypothetical protein